MEEFSVRGLGLSDRSALLDELARSASVAFHAGALEASKPVQFDHQTRRFRGIELTQTHFSNYVGERTAAQAHDFSEPRLVLTVATGPVAIAHGDALHRNTPGSIIPMWSLSPWTVMVPSVSLFRGFSLPLDDLGLPHLLLRNLVSQDIGHSPLASFLASYLADLSALPALDPDNESALAAPSIEIVRALLTTAAGDEFRSREPLGRTLGLRVMAYLKTHATDPDLTVDRVAAYFGVSRRYLFAVMRQRGISMKEWVREERLARAADLLGEQATTHLSVSAVGRFCGFTDHSSFSRAFRGRFGCPPSEWHLLSAPERDSARQAPDARTARVS